jgi:hypothetical protein
MKKQILLAIVGSLMFTGANAQKDVYLNITHKLNTSNFAFNQTAVNDLNQNFRVTRVDYYISSIKIIHDGGLITVVPNKYLLVKGSSNVNELLGNFNVTNVEGIKLSIGVESPTNNSNPTVWPSSHPLALQSPSMHWGWSSGYRFVALEGLAGNNFNTVFEMHGLWNANYFEQTQMATGVNTGNDVTIYLDADYVQAVKGINLQSGPIDHGSNATDLTVLNNFRDFVFSPGSSSTGIADFGQLSDISIYPNPSAGIFHINNSISATGATRLVAIDNLGRTVIDKQLNPELNTISLDCSGAYTVVLFSNNEILGRRLVIIQ